MEIDHNGDRLRAQGYRLTPQRLAILHILDEAEGHLSAQEVFQLAVQRLPGITEPTVYRTLEFLAAQGLALVAHIGSGRLVYESAHHHHHHLVCRGCGATVSIPGDALASLYQELQTSTGFVVDTSHVVFFGHCPQCAPRSGPQKSSEPERR